MLLIDVYHLLHRYRFIGDKDMILLATLLFVSYIYICIRERYASKSQLNHLIRTL
ncbi:hypothetical protein BDV26DRAFT_269265 [Aspergillus bertholletiae]|uniref:Uncharacterized protein n=1 Tax=Aspergillus bertholletiae TaxID=1226010 RepID=A0A5N7AZN0_9EURO|nr:hypothetical protein BDV26DRAFT_269265 [Aspergillus bertholletiae]